MLRKLRLRLKIVFLCKRVCIDKNDNHVVMGNLKVIKVQRTVKIELLITMEL